MNIHFEFKDWQEAFQSFYCEKEKDASICLVVSTHPYSSGYWVDRGAEPDEYTHVYLDVNSVREYEVRVKNAIGSQNAHALGGVVL